MGAQNPWMNEPREPKGMVWASDALSPASQDGRQCKTSKVRQCKWASSAFSSSCKAVSAILEVLLLWPHLILFSSHTSPPSNNISVETGEFNLQQEPLRNTFTNSHVNARQAYAVTELSLRLPSDTQLVYEKQAPVHNSSQGLQGGAVPLPWELAAAWGSLPIEC